MSSYKYCKKRIKRASKLFKLSLLFIWIAIILDLVSFCTNRWIVDVDNNWNYGLWKICVTDPNNATQDHMTKEKECQSITHQGVWAPNMPTNTSDLLPPMWFQAVQTSEVFGFICLAITVAIVSASLCCLCNSRLATVAAFVSALAGIFIDIGVVIILWVFRLYLYYFGFSFWLGFVASILCYITTALLRIDIAKRETLLGKSTEKGLIREVCGCRSPLNTADTASDSPSSAQPPENFYSVWRKKPHKHLADHRPRLSSEVLRRSHYSYTKAPTDVYKPASEGQLASRNHVGVPAVRVPDSPQRRMSCPERRYFATSDVSMI